MVPVSSAYHPVGLYNAADMIAHRALRTLSSTANLRDAYMGQCTFAHNFLVDVVDGMRSNRKVPVWNALRNGSESRKLTVPRLGDDLLRTIHSNGGKLFFHEHELFSGRQKTLQRSLKLYANGNGLGIHELCEDHMHWQIYGAWRFKVDRTFDLSGREGLTIEAAQATGVLSETVERLEFDIEGEIVSLSKVVLEDNFIERRPEPSENQTSREWDFSDGSFPEVIPAYAMPIFQSVATLASRFNRQQTGLLVPDTWR